ncbi:MAG: homoserine O-acetyltransferase [Actinomycetales bacterium]|nr:homoserine O-acetyltransferase [Actinomycetales bacterium]
MSGDDDLPVVTGAWLEGQNPGRRRFIDIGAVDLERGGRLPEVRMAYQSWGTLDATASNAVLVEHALTGDSHVIGSAGQGQPSPGWWEGLVGPGRAIDTGRWFVVAANVIGGCQGTTGPSSLAPDGRAWGSRFPFVTIRDQVEAERLLAEAVGVDHWALVIGGSMGGMRVIEWAVSHPDRVHQAIVLASTAAATADQIAWSQPQLLAIRQDPHFNGGDYYDTDRGPASGLGLARRIAQITYRSAGELDDRFGREPQSGEDPLGGRGRYAIESYLDYHADKLGRRFDANTYLVLTEAMNSHDVGRDRGGIEAALGRVRAHVTAVAVDSDRLYRPEQSAQLAALVPEGHLRTIHSTCGHDGFLIEVDQVGAIVRDALRHVHDGEGAPDGGSIR